MKKFLIATCAATAMLSVPGAAFASTAANGYTAAEPVPLEYWAVRDALSNVSVSPDGKYMALMKIESRDGDPFIEVYDTSDLSEPVSRSNAKPMEFESISWITNDRLFGVSRKIVKTTVKQPEDHIFGYKGFFYDVNKKKFKQIDGSFELVSSLPNEPDHVLLAESNGPAAVSSGDPYAGNRPRSYFRVNTKTGAKQLVYRGGGKQRQADFDINGNVRFSEGWDVTSDEHMYYYRSPSDTSWREFLRVPAEEYTKLDFNWVGDVPGGDGTVGHVLARNNEDTVALWEYDFVNSKFLNKVYGNDKYDIMGVSRGNIRAGDDEIKSVYWFADGVERHFFDQDEKSMLEKIMAAVPGSDLTTLSIVSRSEDDRTMIARNTSDMDSGTYYLIKDGKLLKLGSRNPLLGSEDYSKVEYVEFPARDGLTIPAYVTHPKGDGPHPLIVLPHGGPYVPEVIVYDEWSQMLANNGYMVVQPQYRGSLAHGYNHYIKMWNEHGLAMQDDKDDAAKFLIKRGDVDADRVGMFGWSYGGYAALVAASREDQIYQCTIPAAFVANVSKQHKNRSDDTIKYFDELSAQRGTVSGIDPMKEVTNVNVPMLLIHPRQDRRVMFYHFEDYTSALKKAGKMDNVKTLVLDKADHFLFSHRYDHNITYYTEILDFLQKDCGPGGL
ncbi:alpha/beta hydrolase family protein [Robiginitomaculum antarcticum]|uniref:alpha/beta hydrolase family protein n=1 Tax=Robiginitomaculum antarcticum TaxID=437507 RepID=UPI00036BB7D2|nr:prolyl oligopeptidase family serine peptidase [Robiginitomaculum antarcticum]